MRFDEKVYCGEDCIFVFSSKVYYYVRRENSAVSKTYLFEETCKLVDQFIFSKNITEANKEQLYSMICTFAHRAIFIMRNYIVGMNAFLY